MFISATLFSVYNLIQRKLTAKRGYTSAEASMYSIFVGTLLLTVFAPRAVGELVTAAPRYVLCVLFLGVFSSAIAYFCWAEAFKLAPKTTYVSNYIFTQPFLSGILGYLFLGDRIDASVIIGGLIIFAGLALFYRENFAEALESRAKKQEARKP